MRGRSNSAPAPTRSSKTLTPFPIGSGFVSHGRCERPSYRRFAPIPRELEPDVVTRLLWAKSSNALELGPKECITSGLEFGRNGKRMSANLSPAFRPAGEPSPIGACSELDFGAIHFLTESGNLSPVRFKY